jgi:hypothetical protein
MIVAPNNTEERRETAVASVTVVTYTTTWPAPNVQHSIGEPQMPGFGARLAVRKFGQAINKLADN